MDFVSPEATAPASVAAMLEEAYADLSDIDPIRLAAWRNDWREFDAFVYADARLARNWMFFSRVNEQLAGFVSWDPRERPTARIGHNCVRPRFQGKGIGTAQLLHALDVLRAQGFDKVIVQTGAERFFAPARAMYERAGFTLLRHLDLDEPCPFSAVEYEVTIL